MRRGLTYLGATLVAACPYGCAAPNRPTPYRSVTAATLRSPQLALETNARGLTYVGTECYELAEQAFRDAIQQDPSCAAAHNNLGLALLKTRSAPYEAAIQYALAGKLAPHTPEPRINLATLFERLGWDAEAAAEYERALVIDQNNSEAMGRLAYLYTRMGEEQAVVAPLLRALAGNKGDEGWRRWALAELSESRETASEGTVADGVDASK